MPPSYITDSKSKGTETLALTPAFHASAAVTLQTRKARGLKRGDVRSRPDKTCFVTLQTRKARGLKQDRMQGGFIPMPRYITDSKSKGTETPRTQLLETSADRGYITDSKSKGTETRIDFFAKYFFGFVTLQTRKARGLKHYEAPFGLDAMG